MYKGSTTGVSAEALQARRKWDDVFKMPIGKKTANQEYSTWQSCP